MAKERLYLFDTTLRDGAQTTGVDFSLEDKRLIARTLDELGRRLHRGRLSRRQPDRHGALQRRPRARERHLHRLRHDQARRPLARQRSGLPGHAAGQGRRHLPGRQGLGLSRARGARHHQRGEPRGRRASRCEAVVRRAGREAMIDCEHFFDGYKGNRAYALAVATTAYKAGARWVVLCDTNGGTLPHEIARHRRRRGEARAGHAPRHPHPQRHRERGRQHAGRRARRRAPDPGRAQRAGRALRQRQPHLAHPDPAAQERVRRALRDAGDAGALEEAHARQPPARRAAEPRAQPPGALRRRGGVRHQGRHPRLRHPEGAGNLRARGARDRRQPPPRAGLRPGRQVEPGPRAGAAGHSRRQGRSPRSRELLER